MGSLSSSFVLDSGFVGFWIRWFLDSLLSHQFLAVARSRQDLGQNLGQIIAEILSCFLFSFCSFSCISERGPRFLNVVQFFAKKSRTTLSRIMQKCQNEILVCHKYRQDDLRSGFDSRIAGHHSLEILQPAIRRKRCSAERQSNGPA